MIENIKNLVSLAALSLLVISCSDLTQKRENAKELASLQAQVDSLESLKTAIPEDSKGQIRSFLTFQKNNAEEAMNFYISLFENAKITAVQRYGEEGPGPEGSILLAKFELNGSLFACSDSFITHDWTFTPAVSNFVSCTSEAEIQYLFTQLSENGKALMPLDNYGWSTKFAFVEDRFGVSWQLNLD